MGHEPVTTNATATGGTPRGVPLDSYEYVHGWTSPTASQQLPHDCEVGTGPRICRA